MSTLRQGRSGLGLEAQRTAVTEFLDGGRWQLKQEFVEVESGKQLLWASFRQAVIKRFRRRRATELKATKLQVSGKPDEHPQEFPTDAVTCDGAPDVSP